MSNKLFPFATKPIPRFPPCFIHSKHQAASLSLFEGGGLKMAVDMIPRPKGRSNYVDFVDDLKDNNDGDKR